jgi:RNA recognition motif-containing protein
MDCLKQLLPLQVFLPLVHSEHLFRCFNNLAFFSNTALSTVDYSLLWRGGTDEQKEHSDKMRDNLIETLKCEGEGDVVLAFKVFQHWDTLDVWWNETVKHQDAPYKLQETVDSSIAPFPPVAETSSFESSDINNTDDHHTFEDSLAYNTFDDGDEDDNNNDFPPALTALTASALRTHLRRGNNLPSQQNDETSSHASGRSQSSSQSIGSKFSMALSLASEDTEAEPHSKMSVQEKKRLQIQFCKKMSLNSKSLGIAWRSKSDLKKQLKRLQLWKEAEKSPTNAEIRQLICEGHFLNAAVVMAGKTHRCHALDSNQTGVIHPGSTFLRAKSRRFFVFGKLFRSHKTFMTQNTPVELDWLRASAPHLGLMLDKHDIQEREISPLTPAAISAVLGKRCCKVPEMERITNSNIECQYEPVPLIRVFASRDVIDDAERLIRAEIEKFQKILKDETHEATVIENSSTRAVFGAGAQVQHVLLGDEFIRVNIGNLPNTVEFTESHLQKELMKYGEVVSCGLKPLEANKSSGEKNSSRWGWAQYRTPQQASNAKREFDQTVVMGHVVSCKRGGVHNESQTSMTDSRLELEWSVTESTGRASVTFCTVQGANFALKRETAPDHLCAQVRIRVDNFSPYQVSSGLFKVDEAGNGVLEQLEKRLEMSLLQAGPAKSRGGLQLASASGTGWSVYGASFSSPIPEDFTGAELFVKNLNFSTTEEALHVKLGKLCGTSGEIKKVDIFKKDGKSQGKAKVLASEAAATILLQTRSITLDGREIDIGISVGSKMSDRPAKVSKPQVALLSVGKGVFEIEVKKMHRPSSKIRIGFGLKWAKSKDGADVVMYSSDGKIVVDGKETGYGQTFCEGDIISAAVDMTNGSIDFAKNGIKMGQKKLPPNFKRQLRAIVALDSANVDVNFGSALSYYPFGESHTTLKDCVNAAPPDPEFKLSLTNLPPNIDETHIRDWMAPIGKIKYIHVFREKEPPQGTSTVHFQPFQKIIDYI